MAINLGTGAISKLYLGSNEIQKAYLGGSLVYDAAPAGGLLLDDYPGAAVAYSLRQLRTGVTNVIRVRESGGNTEADFTPTQITDGTLTAFCGANDGFVTVWYDQSGNGNNAVQTTVVNQPKIVNSGNLILQNGKPIITFTTTTFMRTAAFAMGVNRTYIMTLYNAINTFGVFKAYLAFNLNGGYGDNIINGIFGGFNSSHTPTSYVANGVTNTRTGNTALTGNTYYLISALVEGSVQHQIYRNGVLNSQNTSLAISPQTAARTLDILFTGENNQDLRTNEAILWDNYQSANRTAIENNINAHYGIY